MSSWAVTRPEVYAQESGRFETHEARHRRRRAPNYGTCPLCLRRPRSACPRNDKAHAGADVRMGRLSRERLGRSARSCLVLALDDVVDLEHLGLAFELDPSVLEHRHQTLAEGVELLARVPNLANAEIPLRAESDVVGKSLRRP